MSQDQTSLDEVTQILTGYCDVFDCFKKHREEITAVFENRKEEMAKIPIRHILRDTIHYRKWKINEPETPFFNAELSQLERGDIPYFFKFLGHENLYAYADSEGAFQKVTAPEFFQKGIVRDATSPATLLFEDRIEGVLFPSGLLFLAKTLLSRDFDGSLLIGDVRLTQNRSQISIKVDSFEYQVSLG